MGAGSSMYEPLLDVAVPLQIARVWQHRQRGNATSEKIIIMPQVYDNQAGQTNILLTCLIFMQEAGIRLIAVEGTDTQLQATGQKMSIEKMIRETTNYVSAGVL